MSELENLRDALSKIADIASSVEDPNKNDYDSGSEAVGVCTPKSLPLSLQVRAASTAVDQNPMNAPVLGFAPQDGDQLSRFVADPQNIAVLTSKYWGPALRRLTVSFMESTPADLRSRIISHLNAWSCGVQFVFTTGVGQVRISRGAGGFWSYLGTDVLHISTSRPTMNLQGFTMSTRDSEFRRVIRHEAGHTLGFPHEHMRRQLVARIDPEKAYEYFRRTQGWSRAMVDQQVLTPLDDRSIMSTPADQTSCMCYQLPGEITRDGRPIIGGNDINTTDRAFAQRIYPVGLGMGQESDSERSQSYNPESDESEFIAEPVLAD